ncbi:hypothetical protein BN85406690 [Alteracholeplasma palmae J233]|uniref:DUF4434 domain-containing protein n=1 Tax=Alteracholeplasma palmae (strain ATCC 49389 / J233) TaxID=1318466 RepID=U4KRK5_ALTPJ|nr:DUF4434 domain-containing protein [Alteracholeplasma palmae]CCV64246.1 hypothetical protein BN85406690 [Alteracholeplasma palmae J233]
MLLIFLVEKTAATTPKITKDFIQPWAITYWDETDYDKHFEKLKELDINEIILQWTIETKGDELSYRLYPSSLETKEKYDTVLYKFLKQAKKNDIKVYIGLNNDLLWWQDYQNNLEYLKERNEVSKLIIKEIYDLYYEEFKETIKGFYSTFEMYTNNSNFSDNWAYMINDLVLYFENNNLNLPIIFSFFLSEYAGGSNEDIFNTFDLLFKTIKLREIDIILPMDGYMNAANNAKKFEKSKLYLDTMYDCFIKYQKAQFIINIEMFYEDNAQFKVASFKRIKEQLKNANKYNKEEIVSFSVSHHIIIEGNQHIYADYKRYVSKK